MSVQHFVVPYRVVFLLVLVLGLAAAAALAYLYLPAASITIAAATEERQAEREILLSTHIQEPDFVRFELPAKVVEREAQETRRIERVGAQATEDYARGKIVLVNELDEEQPLLPKTHLRHEATGVFFLTDTPVTMAPNSRVAMTVTAKEKGATGNVPPGKYIVDKLPANTQAVVYGESDQELSGGIIIESPLTEDEINLAREDMLDELRERLRGELTAEAGGAALRGDLLMIDIIEEARSAEIGSKAQEFSLKLKVRARAFVVNENDLLSLTLLALRSDASPTEEFLSYEPESFSLSVIKTDFDRGEVRMAGRLTGKYGLKVGPTALSGDNLAGLTRDEVKEHFDNFPEVGEVDIAFSPFWVKAVPARPKAVDIAIKDSVL